MLNYLCAEICRGCDQLLAWRDDGFNTLCDHCLSDLDIAPNLEVCDAAGYSLVVAHAIKYENPLSTRLVRELKYRGDRLIAGDLSRAIEPAYWQLSALFGTPPHLVPVPLHWTRLAYRGFNQAELIATFLAERIGARVLSSALRRQRRTVAHHGLGREARSKNVSSAFKARYFAQCAGPLLIVDDVYTSGATLSECCTALRTAGYTQVAALAVARANIQITTMP